MAEGNRERHDDHAGEGEIQIHQRVILSFLEWAIVNSRNAKKKFALSIPMIESIDSRRVCI
ncbi:MAG TPA: hypothetical protein VNV36_04130 [Pseudomonas sp.]|uniref:hypothetical protein n=1 Tax=Pseudomonas sp. TaxID=306 RepID=UPI002CD7B621|nr:hypothetical protein [Pseudomonas sp.]HWH85945.1 hypothetical protein [Pseudomonas sp.]